MVPGATSTSGERSDVILERLGHNGSNGTDEEGYC